MLERAKRRMTYGNVMATLAFFVALGGTGYAATVITGAQVKNDSLTGADIKNGSLVKADFKAGQIPKGPKGPAGPGGPAGAAGAAGAAGPAGPAGPAGAGAKSIGITYKQNAVQPTTTIFTGSGFKIEASCPSNAGPTVIARSTADHGIAASFAINGVQLAVTQTASDFDFNTNETLTISNQANFEGNGVFNMTSASGATTTVSFLVNFATTQGDCIFVGNVITA